MAWRCTAAISIDPMAGVPQRPWLLNVRSPEQVCGGKLLMGLGSHCLAHTLTTQTSGPLVTSHSADGYLDRSKCLFNKRMVPLWVVHCDREARW
jgi:hypothetical protein